MMKKKLIFCAFLFFGQIFCSFGQLKITFKTGKIAALKDSSPHLFLAGDFNNWNPGDSTWEMHAGKSGSYSILRTLPTGNYNFKVTRGSWQTVECNSAGKPIDNRSFYLKHDTIITMNIEDWQDNYAVVPKKHTASPQVHIISEKFNIPQLGRQRRIWIYLPVGYKASKRKYPVIYMQDGQNLFDEYTAAYGEWGIDEIMDKMPPGRESIIVGIDNGGDYRMTEYNPYDSEYGKGRGNDYVDFLVGTLKPYIDKHFRTKASVGYTTIAGSSMGALISMYAALKYPHVFGNAGIFSPAFWITPQIYGFAQNSKLSKKARFYFVCGDTESEHMVTDMQKMAQVILNKGIAVAQSPVIIVKGASHNEKQWNADFPAFYNWLMKF